LLSDVREKCDASGEQIAKKLRKVDEQKGISLQVMRYVNLI
jgi:hypothetical protein